MVRTGHLGPGFRLDWKRRERRVRPLEAAAIVGEEVRCQ
jgi:hypothetical protein